MQRCCKVIPALLLRGLILIVSAMLLISVVNCEINLGHPPPDLEYNEIINARRIPQWTQDGETIVVNIAGRLIGVRADGTDAFPIGNPGNGQQYSPSMAPDGRVVYEIGFYRDVWDQVYERHIGINNIHEPEQKPDTHELHVCYPVYPVFSPDGTKFAFISVPGCGKESVRDLVVWSSSGHEEESIEISRGISGAPVWSNTGTHVAVLTENGHRYGISIIDYAEKTEQILIADIDTLRAPAWLSSPAWSHDDSSLYYVRHEIIDNITRSALYSIAIDGGNEQHVVDLGDIRVCEISPSPDGKKLLFDAQYVIDLDSTDIVLIESHGTCYRRDSYASWSPDGNKIAMYRSSQSREYLEAGSQGAVLRTASVSTVAPDGSDSRTLLTAEARVVLNKDHPHPAIELVHQ